MEDEYTMSMSHNIIVAAGDDSFKISRHCIKPSADFFEENQCDLSVLICNSIFRTSIPDMTVQNLHSFNIYGASEY
jgi:hypothetical protein